MQPAHNSATFATAILPCLPIHAQVKFEFNQSPQGALSRVTSQHGLYAHGAPRGGWWIKQTRTGVAGRIHCEGSTK
jgi:hypothetical protein